MTGLLLATAVSKTYGARPVLQAVDLQARAGRVHAILGPSGSGKSTLLRILHGLEAPDAGAVRLGGRSVGDLDATRKFGLVQQTPGLLRASTLANAAFPLRARGATRTRAFAEARAWLDRLGIGSLAAAHAHDLSGGEAQRLALARALATRPDVLLLDEATNQLDPESVRLVESILREEAERGAALVLVSHSVAQARRLAHDATFLHGGRVLANGAASAVLGSAEPRIRSFVELG